MIIDCHGHYTTAPKQLEALPRTQQIAALEATSAAPRALSDHRRRDPREHRGRASSSCSRSAAPTSRSSRRAPPAWRHHIGDATTSAALVASLQRPDPPRRARSSRRTSSASASCRSRPGVSPANCIAELERCVKEFGFVGCNLNPDPSGGYWKDPPLTDRCWYPLYEKMVELDVPAMVHVSASCNPNFHATGAHYINGDTTAFMQFITVATCSRISRRCSFIIPHGGGAVPYHWGRYRGLAQDMKRPPLDGAPAEERLLRHLRLSPAGHRPADQGHPGRQHPVRLGDGRRGARHRSRDRPPLRRHQALCRQGADLRRRQARRSSKAMPRRSSRASTSPTRRTTEHARPKGDRFMSANGPLPPPEIALENDYVRVSRNKTPFAGIATDRVIVAVAPLSFMAGDALQSLERGEFFVFGPGDTYQLPADTSFFEVAIKPDHPPVKEPPRDHPAGQEHDALRGRALLHL